MSADNLFYLIAYVQFYQGEGIQKSLLIKNCGKVVSAEIQDRLSKEKHQWPPTTQDKTPVITMITVITLCSILYQFLVLTLLWMKMGL